MSNAISLNWLNLSIAISRLPNEEQPVLQEQLRKEFGGLLDWYREFTDVSADQLKQVEEQFDASLGQTEKICEHGLRGAVYSTVEFLRAYMEPGEIVNMSQFGANVNENAELSNMIGRLADFHTGKLKSFKWLVDWLEEVDPLFPSEIFRNKLACCFSKVNRKPCYTNNRQCIFKSSLSWIRTPAVTLSSITSKGDCCLGSTLSSCSGGTLECDCVAGRTGCDCKSPKQLCSQNDRSVMVSAAGFGDISDQTFNLLDKDQNDDHSLKQPVCLVLDPSPHSSSIQDQIPSAFKGPLCLILDPGNGRFITSKARRFNLGRLVMTTQDCQQTGFCPPKSSGCDGLC
ncbi:MAG: hypothetical protein ACYDHX_04130 [Methanothrix sp.]